MMKALIVGADSVTPEIIFGENICCFPNLCKLVNQGASASYSAYVQKGYAGSYSSEQNWASIYTGLSPKEHKINTNMSRGEKRHPQMKDFDTLDPFWKKMNEKGYSVGLWAADNCVSPVPIDGYVISVDAQMLDTPAEERKIVRKLQCCEKDKPVLQLLTEEPPPRLYPKTLKQQGYTFEQLKDNPDMAEEAIRKYHFQDALVNFEEELMYWFHSMKKIQQKYPVDVLYLYTPTTDLIAHCCMCCDNNEVLIEAYKILDRVIGQMMEEFAPEITIFLSDHGQQNFKELIPCTDDTIKREAFSAKDEVLWLKNGYIAFEAHNGALLFTAHALKGTWIAAGKGLRHTVVSGMRTVDIYPTIMELFDIKLPAGRSGYIADVFDHPIAHSDRILNLEQKKNRSIALIQTHAVNITDIIINELFIENRFADITVVGAEKYREIFLGNPRVKSFIPYEQLIFFDFDEIYCGIYYEEGTIFRHIKISQER